MILLDERGKQCPLPVVEAKRALEEVSPGEVVAVVVDNEIAVQNLQKMAGHKNFEAGAAKTGEREWTVQIAAPLEKKPVGCRDYGADTSGDMDVPGRDEEAVCETKNSTGRGRRENMVVVISSEGMGSGDDKLAGILMKGFVYALARQERLPGTVLLYNGGARLSCEGSDSLEDLQSLAKAGVEILTCGTCLDFYGLKERLRVGEVTNMYEIVERQTEATLVIRP